MEVPLENSLDHLLTSTRVELVGGGQFGGGVPGPPVLSVDPHRCLVWLDEVPLQDLAHGREVVAVGLSVREASKHLIAIELLEVEILSLAS